jgi:hypothetical protein
MTSVSNAIPRQSQTCVRAKTGALLLLVVFGGRAQGLPPPPEQTGADCESPVYASDQLICADPELRVLDADNALKAKRIGPVELTGDSLFETNEIWLRRRSRCAFENNHRACLIDAYRDRARMLSALTSTPTSIGKLACGSAWAKRDLQVATDDRGTMRVTEGGRLFAVATQPVPGSAWQPAVVGRAKGWTDVFVPLGSPAVRCVSTP